MFRRLSCLAYGAVLLAALSNGLALGQDKKEQHKSGAYKPDAPARKSDTSQKFEVDQEFIDAYKRLGSPKLMIFTHFIGDEWGDSADLIGFDPRLRYYFQHPEIAVVAQPVLDEKKREELDALMRTDQVGAAQLMRAQKSYDYLLLVVWHSRGSRRADVAYQGAYYLIDGGRAEVLDSWSFDVKPDPDDKDLLSRRLGQYAASTAKRVRDRLKLRAGEVGASPVEKSSGAAALGVAPAGGAMRRFEIQTTGIGSDEADRLYRAAQGMPGVKSVKAPRVDEGNSAKLVVLELMWGGEPHVLADEARATWGLTLNKTVTCSRASEGLITLDAKERNAESVLCAGGAEQQSGLADLQGRLERAYRKALLPRIAVMVNKEEPGGAPSNQPGAAPDAGGMPPGNGPAVVVQNYNAPVEAATEDSTRDKPINPDVISARMVETRLFEKLKSLKLTLVTPEIVRRNIDEEVERQGKVWRAETLARLIGDKKVAEIVVMGVTSVSDLPRGGAVRTADNKVVERTQNVKRVQLSLLAYRTESGIVDAATAEDRNIDVVDGDVGKAIDNIICNSVGRLVEQMITSWTPPQRVEIGLAGAQNVGDVQAIADFVKAKIPGVLDVVNGGYSSSPAAEGGIGTLWVIFDGVFDDLIRTLRSQKDLPFSIDVIDSKNGKIGVKLTGKVP